MNSGPSYSLKLAEKTESTSLMWFNFKDSNSMLISLQSTSSSFIICCMLSLIYNFALNWSIIITILSYEYSSISNISLFSSIIENKITPTSLRSSLSLIIVFFFLIGEHIDEAVSDFLGLIYTINSSLLSRDPGDLTVLNVFLVGVSQLSISIGKGCILTCPSGVINTFSILNLSKARLCGI